MRYFTSFFHTVLKSSTSQFRQATFQVLKSHMWLVATLMAAKVYCLDCTLGFILNELCSTTGHWFRIFLATKFYQKVKWSLPLPWMKMNEDTVEASERTGCWDLGQISCLCLSLLDDNNICVKRKVKWSENTERERETKIKTDATEKKKKETWTRAESEKTLAPTKRKGDATQTHRIHRNQWENHKE